MPPPIGPQGQAKAALLQRTAQPADQVALPAGVVAFARKARSQEIVA